MSLQYRMWLDADDDARFTYKGHEYSHLKILITGERIEDIVDKVRHAARQIEIAPDAIPNKPHAQKAIEGYISLLRELKPHVMHNQDRYTKGGNQNVGIEAILPEFFHDTL